MHGRTYGWLAFGLAIAAACATCNVAVAQHGSPMLPSDPGYTIAADSGMVMPALQPSASDAYLVSNNTNAALAQRVNAHSDSKEDGGGFHRRPLFIIALCSASVSTGLLTEAGRASNSPAKYPWPYSSTA